MSGKFDLKDYTDVAERTRLFYERYPDGSLQSEVSFVDGGVLCKAYAYRNADDPRPGIGHAFEPVPGKTPYTKDSEVMNAETSAWGRAIVACGFETKKIASADEVRNRSAGAPPGPRPARSAAEAPPTPAPPAEKPLTVSESPIGQAPSREELQAFSNVADALIASGEMTSELLQDAAARYDPQFLKIPYPGLADVLPREAVLDLTERLTRFAATKKVTVPA